MVDQVDASSPSNAMLPIPPIPRIHHVAILCSNDERSRAFHMSVLGAGALRWVM